MSTHDTLPSAAKISRAFDPGEFDLIEKVGAGTCGEVWRAVQRQTGRTVAIKFLARLSDPASTRVGPLEWRFQREIEAAAQQDHPHIAAIVASGVSRGCPWLAMEFVDGARLDEFAASLPLRERLALFRRVCEGVQHAHDNGVIHRDLKPANILVRADGTPKILDFGLARFLDDAGLGQTLTLDGQLLGTPLFMAPEQAAGKTREISVATDVYALGVILHRLATGEWPFDDTLPTLELLAAVRDTEPRAPRGIPRDLAAIIGKTMAREKGERYPSVREISEDVARFLAREPVAARSWSPGYVLRKRVRKHWRACVAASALLVLAAGFLEARRRAAAQNVRALAQARELVNVMLFDIREKLHAIGQPELYSDIAAKAAKLPWPVDAGATGDLNLHRSRALAASLRGDILTRNGDAPKAMEAYREAGTHLSAIAKAHPGEAQYEFDVARTRLSHLTALAKAGHHSEAVSGARALIEKIGTLRDPVRLDQREMLRAETVQLIGETFRDGGSLPEAEKELRHALMLFSKPPVEDPARQAFIRESLGSIQRRSNRPAEAIATLAVSEDFYRRALPGSSGRIAEALTLARCLIAKAAAHTDLRQLADSQRCLDEARDLCPAPTDAASLAEKTTRRHLAIGYSALAVACTDAGDDAAALAAAREAGALWKVVFRRGASLTADRIAFYEHRCHMAEIFLRQRDVPSAAAHLREALAQAKRLSRERVDDPRWYLATIEIELQLLALPQPAGAPPRADQLARIDGLFSQFDATPANAAAPHQTKADALKARFSRERATPHPPGNP